MIRTFSTNENTKKIFVSKVPVSTETLTKDFCLKKTQSVTVSYHVEKLHW